ncbi:DEAD-box ATP-dependent RNA helicase 39 [Impatiens glandulifera]|uniref:DEAD-box ATP-dependent RNA helicase 39 n=1 Tax=Impatiens glandulifera TaxID=253017 RepID=UPI001FB063A0|nr:DEAD-box ATP-dependent RNA helicase 39 [Impatiens glandulifera]
MGGGGTARTLLSLSSSCSSSSSSLSSRFSFSLLSPTISLPLRRMLSQSLVPSRFFLRFSPLCSTSSAVAFPTSETEAVLQPTKHSALLEKLRIRHLKDATLPAPRRTAPVTISSTDDGADKKKKKNEVLASTFQELGLTEEVMGALGEMGISVPTEIQSIGMPAVLQGKTVVLGSHTGSGKTLAYMLPLVQLLRRDEVLHGKGMKPRRPRAVVLCPTRELNEQVFRVAKSICHHARFRVTMISGGTSIGLQEDSLNGPIDMVVGTPGRVLQHIEDGNMVYGDIKYVVLDEADTMFDRGFGPDIRKFLAPLKNRASKSNDDGFQTILVSATMTKGVQSLVDEEFQGIIHLRTSTLHKKIASARHDFIKLSGSENKLEALLQVLEPSLAKGNRVMIFCNTLNSSRAVDHYLTENSVSTVNYHGEVPAEERVENLKKFKSDDGDCPTLVCTDLAARGLDLDVDHVIMFDFPKNSIDYLHRTGRTARMGAKGKVTSLIARKDQLLAKRIEEAITKNESLESLSVDNVRRDIARSKITEQKNFKATKFSMEKNNKKVSPTNSSSTKGRNVIASSKTKSAKVSVPLKKKVEIKVSKSGSGGSFSKPNSSKKSTLGGQKQKTNRNTGTAQSGESKLNVVGFRARSSSAAKPSKFN